MNSQPDSFEEDCYINFDENILISCLSGKTLIDRLDNFLTSSEETLASSYIIVDNFQRSE